MCNTIIDAILSVDDINNEFVKRHKESNEGLFRISIENVDASIKEIKDL